MGVIYESVLKQLGIKNPWEEPYKKQWYDSHGWFTIGNADCMDKLYNGGKIAIELGSWLGSATRHLAKSYEVVIAIDHWKGNKEHQNPSRKDVFDKLPTLYDQFLSNCVNLRHKIIPLRMSTEEAAQLPLPQADLIYVDAAHDNTAVLKDLRMYYKFLLSNGTMCGDDWNWGRNFKPSYPIRVAVTEFSEENNLKINHNNAFWWLTKGA